MRSASRLSARSPAAVRAALGGDDGVTACGGGSGTPWSRDACSTSGKVGLGLNPNVILLIGTDGSRYIADGFVDGACLLFHVSSFIEKAGVACCRTILRDGLAQYRAGRAGLAVNILLNGQRRPARRLRPRASVGPARSGRWSVILYQYEIIKAGACGEGRIWASTIPGWRRCARRSRTATIRRRA